MNNLIMKCFLGLVCALVCSCKPVDQAEKEYITPEEKKVLDEMQKAYQK